MGKSTSQAIGGDFPAGMMHGAKPGKQWRRMKDENNRNNRGEFSPSFLGPWSIEYILLILGVTLRRAILDIEPNVDDMPTDLTNGSNHIEPFDQKVNSIDEWLDHQPSLCNNDEQTNTNVQSSINEDCGIFVIKLAEYIFENKIKHTPKKFDTNVARHNMAVQLYKFTIEKPDLQMEGSRLCSSNMN
ncbi:Papain-like cysteine peptidase superfamily [Forsythia ovata]|uniref:Papain-like cysteine peptidase superfamily n=1 Tax=Forsythia ovata TaxID=205694 RepID=A0ABD1P2F2_9LAMI